MGEKNYYKGTTPKTIVYGKIMAFCLGFYDGFLGPGTAAFLMFCLIKIFKFRLFLCKWKHKDFKSFK